MQNTYDANGNVVAVTDPLGRVTETWYDARNRAIETALPPAYDATAGQLRRARSTTEYDRLGRVVSTTDAFGQVTTQVYDRASRLLETHLPPVSVNGGAPQALMTRSEYDANGNVVEVFDTLGNSTVNEYDALNRLVKTTDALNQVTEFGYDGAGNRTSVKDPKGNITTWAYDDLKRVLSETTPAGVIVNHEYDALNKTRTVDAKGQVTTYHYDNRHRLTQMKLYVDAQTPTPHNVRTYGYDNAGLLLSVTESADATVNVSYTYDALGKTLSETSRGFTHSYQYDLAGNRVKTTYGGGTGRVVHHAYDGVNRLISLTEASRVTNWEYDLAGRCVAMTQGNGLVQRQSYDAHGRLIQRALYDEDVPSALMSVELAYDALGNVVRQQERWNQTAGGAVPTSNRTTTMAYDLTSRLVNETAVQHADGSSVSTTYEYDAASNRSKKVISGGTEPGTSTYTYNALNQLTGFEERASNETLRKSVSYTYDANGNRTNRIQSGQVSHEYAWDWNNRLAEVETLHGGGSSTVNSYDYDYRMRRVTRVEGSGTAITYSGGVSVAEFFVNDPQQGTLNEAPDVEYVRGPDMGGGVGGLLYSLRSDHPVRFSVSNGRGDVVAQSDETGALLWTAIYEAFGKRPVEVGSNPDRQRANTKEEDPTGLLYEGWRYRDLETGTWLSRDPAGFVDGPNLYAYVQQNPWTKFDPDGLDDKDANAKKEVKPKIYKDRQVQFMDAQMAESHYRAWAKQREEIYRKNKPLLEKNLFTTSDKGPETVTLTRKTDRNGAEYMVPGKPGKPAMNPEADALWRSIYLDDGQGKGGASSQLGECASLPINLAKVPSDTKTWKPGGKVLGNKVLPGTAIATFDEDGKYNGTSGGHSAIFIRQTEDSITVVEQFNPGHGGRYPIVRTLKQSSGGGVEDISNTADHFQVIQTDK